MERYTILFEPDMVEALTGIPPTERRRLRAFFGSLTVDPHDKGDYEETTPGGRKLQVKIVGSRAIGYYVEEAAKLVWVNSLGPADR